MGIFGAIGRGFQKIPGHKVMDQVGQGGMEEVEAYTGLSKEQQMILAANVGGLAMDVMSGNPVGAAADLASIYGQATGNEQIQNYADAVGAVSGIGSSLAAAAKTAAKQTAKATAKQAAKAAAKGTAKAVTKEAAIEASKAAVSKMAKEGAKVALKPVAMEATKGAAKQAGQEVLKNALTDITKQSATTAASAAAPDLTSGLSKSAMDSIKGSSLASVDFTTPAQGALNESQYLTAGTNYLNPVERTSQQLYGFTSKTNGAFAQTSSISDVYGGQTPAYSTVPPGTGLGENIDLNKKNFGAKLSSFYDQAKPIAEGGSQLYGAYQDMQNTAQQQMQMNPQAQQMLAQIRGQSQPTYGGEGTVASRIARMHRGY